MLEKKNLLGIKELKLQDILEQLDDAAYNGYCELLDRFIDKFPEYETALNESFKAGNSQRFLSVLAGIKEMLTQIHADDLVVKCDSAVKSLINPNRDMAEASLLYFLTSISMLSIEIQMARHKTDSPESENTIIEVVEEQKQKCILAVDDVALLLNTLRASLQNSNYKFIGVTSGAAALKFLSTHQVDLFLLDIEMPDMNGYELAQNIKKDGHTAPIIFLTGHAKKEYVVKAMQVGASDFIVKPISKDQVLEKIEKYI